MKNKYKIIRYNNSIARTAIAFNAYLNKGKFKTTKIRKI